MYFTFTMMKRRINYLVHWLLSCECAQKCALVQYSTSQRGKKHTKWISNQCWTLSFWFQIEAYVRLQHVSFFSYALTTDFSVVFRFRLLCAGVVCCSVNPVSNFDFELFFRWHTHQWLKCVLFSERTLCIHANVVRQNRKLIF